MVTYYEIRIKGNLANVKRVHYDELPPRGGPVDVDRVLTDGTMIELLRFMVKKVEEGYKLFQINDTTYLLRQNRQRGSRNDGPGS